MALGAMACSLNALLCFPTTQPDAAAIAAATAKPQKASVITEKHWDPDTPGVVTERVTKVDGEEVEGGGGGAAGATDGDGDSASAGPRKLSEAQFAIVQRILDHMRMQVGGGRGGGLGLGNKWWCDACSRSSAVSAAQQE